jgi:hypothetical protein
MALDPKKIASALGAVHQGQVADVGGGAFGAARLAQILKERLEPSKGRRPGRPTNVTWVQRPKIPISVETQEALILLAKKMSTDERKISPMQVAAQLLEDAVKAASARRE